MYGTAPWNKTILSCPGGVGKGISSSSVLPDVSEDEVGIFELFDEDLGTFTDSSTHRYSLSWMGRCKSCDSSTLKVPGEHL